MNNKNYVYDNVDGKKYYGVTFSVIHDTNFDDIKVTHEAGKSSIDVEVVKFSFGIFKKFPQGLTKVFPNIKILDISHSNLKILSKTDLIEYKNLRGFFCDDNNLEFLPGDLFEDFTNLEWITFRVEKLELVEPNILDGLEKLKHVDFRKYLNSDKLFSIYPKFESNATLKGVKNELSEKFFSSSDSENIKTFIKRIQENAKKSELDLIQKIQELTEGIQELKNSSIVCDLKSHIQNESLKDFKILIDNREFYVHKFLLAMRSPTLAEMLRNNPKAENLILVDIPVDIFEVILKFLYTDELPHDDGMTFECVFAAASRLKIKKLINYAAMKVLDQMNFKNAIDIFCLGNKYGHDGLRQKAFEEIMKKYPAIEFKDDMATDIEKVKKTIEYVKELEAIEKKFSTLMD